MTTFNYNRNIPNAPNNPSSDQPLMQINTNSIEDLLDVDHFSFGETNGGTHKQVQLINQIAIPSGLFAGEGTLYTKFLSGLSQLFYTPDASGNEYQLSNVDTLNFSTFSTFTVYNGAIPNLTGGWTFLPGGMILNYGLLASPVNGNTITYAKSYTSFALPLITPMRNNTDDKTVSIKSASNTNSQFQIILSTSDVPTFLFWIAVGK